MKNMKRVWSILLTLCMLLGLITLPAGAMGEMGILSHPEDVTVEYGEKVTFKVNAVGTDLQYRWHNYYDYSMDDPDVFSGVNSATLTIKDVSCMYDGVGFYCEVWNDVGMETSNAAVLYVDGHGEPLEYYYDEKSHLAICSDCFLTNDQEAHAYGGDNKCDVCGYVKGAAADREPIILDESGYDQAFNGEELQFIVKGYGVGIKYQWFEYDPETETKAPLSDGSKYAGTKTRKLTVKNVDCSEGEMVYYTCRISNAVGETEITMDGYVMHNIDLIPATTMYHEFVCADCGTSETAEPHTDSDCDAVCDLCGFIFTADCPKITAQPKDVEVKNGHAPAKITVTATGKGLTYQWYRWGDPMEDDEKYSGTNTATLTIKSTYDPENGEYDCGYVGGYYCRISNAYGAVESDSATYDVEHKEIVYYDGINAQRHDCYCICGEWAGDAPHVDAQNDHRCDLCDRDLSAPFKDVTNSKEWYYNAAVYGKESGIFRGSYGNFNPESNITRGEMVTVLARLGFTQRYIDGLNDYEFEELLSDLALEYGTTPVEFTDVEGEFYERHARILAAMGIVNGYANNRFKGENFITREELATILVRFLNLVEIRGMQFSEPIDSFKDADKVSDWAVEYVEAAREMGIFQGDNGKFKPASNATRAEVAQTLMRMDLPEGIFLYWY